MKQANEFAYDMLDIDVDNKKIVCCAGLEIDVSEKDGIIMLDIPFYGYSHNGTFKKNNSPPSLKRFFLSSWGSAASAAYSCLRFSGPFECGIEVKDIYKDDCESPMLCFSELIKQQPLRLKEIEKDLFIAVDQNEKTRMRLSRIPHTINYWSDLQGSSDPMIQLTLFPDGVTPVTFASYDQFFPGKFESMPLAFTEKEMLFSVFAEAEEHFYGTGERFGRLDLSGRTVTLENTDALGTDSRKAYKNIPFYLSSRGYGLFIHSSAHIRLSFADISSRAVQGSVADNRLDMFLFGGNTLGTNIPFLSGSSSIELVLFLYRCITGFSPNLPLWSYGMWMSRMTYISDDEIRKITERLRNENYPCDVIHIDTGYFETDWVCEWDFSKSRFPSPNLFMKEMLQKGFRICLWQTPNIGRSNKHYEEGVSKKYLPQIKNNIENIEPISDFSGQDHGISIDFSNTEAVEWYKNHLRRLMDYGASAIKTDFGEKINMLADYKMKTSLLHNLYGLLYQRAAREVLSEYSECPVGWSRAGWAGCQRFPLHWGGDTSSTWDGLAATLRGGLSIGLSGFCYWSHDIPGFHGLPDFMNSKPDETLYLRWTQFGVFTSHMRYHGSYPREPWEYPGVADLARKMLVLRYALLPYIMQEGEHCGKSGRAIISPLFLDNPDDPAVWSIDTQYLFGRDMLVSPIMNDEGIRDIYLPEGVWMDFFTGESFTGTKWLKKVKYPLERFPVFVRKNSVIPLYPEAVSSTNEMNLEKIIKCKIDDSFLGIYQVLQNLFNNSKENRKNI